MDNILYFVLYYSATVEGRVVTAAQIDSWHKARGWRKIGYHDVVRLDGTIERGRNLNEPGAHVPGYNSNSIGICYVGGIDRSGCPKDTRTSEQKASLYFLLQQLRDHYPHAEIRGHHDCSPDLNGNRSIEPFEYLKACPSFDACLEDKEL